MHRLKTASPLLVVVYVGIAAIVWAAITPPGGVPDEPSHIVYAAGVVRGDLGTAVDTDDGFRRILPALDVPEWVTTISVCYRGKPSNGRIGGTADCQPALSDSSSIVPATTTVTKYPPPYYWIAGTPSLVLSGPMGLYAMRVASALLFAALIAIGLGIASPGRRPWMAMAVVLAYTPSSAHIAGSVNPSALEIGAALGLAVGLLGLGVTGQPSRRMFLEALGLVILGCLLAWSRPTGPYYVLPVVLVSSLFNWSGLRAWARQSFAVALSALGIVFAAMIGAVAFHVVVRSPLDAVVRAGTAPEELFYDRVSLWANVDVVLSRLQAWSFDAIGQFGWLDHSAPRVAQLLWIGLLLSVLTLALASASNGRRLLLVGVVIGATILTPLVVLVAVFGGGDGYQARYHLPVMILIPLVSLFVLGGTSEAGDHRLLRPILGWIGIVAPLVMLVSIVWSFSRYAVDGMPVWTDVLGLRFIFERVWGPGRAAAIVAVLGGVGLVVSAGVLRAVGRQAVDADFDGASQG